MSGFIPWLVAGCLGFATVIAVIFFHAHQLRSERQRDSLPDEHACEIGIGAGDAFTHRGLTSPQPGAE